MNTGISINRGEDEYYMRMALSLAMRGTGAVSPNPRVGCVIVDGGRPGGEIVAWGYHRAYGAPHAEADALRRAGGQAPGCTVYVNLEPCCHEGKTPPCCNALIEAGVGRVVMGMEDPNPLVSGGGAKRLSEAGIEVTGGILADECRRINRGFIRNITAGRPWITVKAAVSCDGDMALLNGESRWISGEESRRRVHMARAENDAVLVGIGTVLSDDPALTVRDTDGRSPLQVVVDNRLDTPPDSRILAEGRCLIFAGRSAGEERERALLERGAAVIRQEKDGSRIELDGVVRELGLRGVNYLMVEGGPRIISSFINERLVDEFSLFKAPKIMGRGMSMAGDVTLASMKETISMKRLKVNAIKEDIWIEGVASCSPDL
ncbi:MAG: bifunctional diaminohydroxyphosphoribosylaminopyrimidine deaminase/5-amino-6-(5-phosphoribosylamino)uracil reductase RibD [Synergistaceae bacterium]|nr:bifunctional diaminohydroxyphosphoribosylaminopyrimidine deaminase/5-amino-6-(5-phosphoribosylamino)uracil reductase RibD [Synergistaceae bacterium]